jgi:penicillin G amidase
MPGMPFVVIGHNRRCAWGFTNSFADCQDLVIEEFDSPAAERCRTERGFEPTRLVREVIHVRRASDEIEEVVSTRHGPVVERVDDPVRNVWRGLALQWTALTPAATAEALLRLQRAGDWETFRAAFDGMDAPAQNVVYADVDGHIGYLLCGRVPVRRRAPSGLPVPGWSGDAMWTRFLSPSEMPAVLDPPEQSIITANNRVVGAGFPHYISSDYMNGYRAARLAALLDSDRMDAAFMNDVQMDLACPPATQVIELLRSLSFASPAAEHARRALVQWDGVMRPSQMEPTLYEAFMERLAERALTPVCGPAWRVVAGVGLSHPLFGYPGNIVGRLTPDLLRRWESDDVTTLGGATWADTAAGALDEAWHALRRRYGRSTLRWRWGRIHAIALTHPFGRRRLPGLIFNGGRVSVGGSMDTVMATSFVPGQPFATRLFAPSWRQVIDVGDWDACTGIHLPGQSGQPGSRHYRDLRTRWRSNRQVPLHWSWDRVRRSARSGLRIAPSAQALGRQGREAA